MFDEIPATKLSRSMRSFVYGVGINDADYLTQRIVNGIRLMCPFYSRWAAMMSRCYCPIVQAKYPTYEGCTVSSEWLTFSVFKGWMMQQDWEGNHLDKDLLVQGNKVYSSDLCLFVNQSINLLLNDSKASRGKYPLGVSLNRLQSRFVSNVVLDGKKVRIGTFDTPKEAHEAYKKAKHKIIKDVAMKQVEPLRSALLNYKIK